MAKTRYTPHVVAGFGGGLNFTGHPTALRDDEWTDSDGWLARLGYAETLPAFVQTHSTANWTGATTTDRPIGIIQWPFGDDPGVFVAFINEVTTLPKLYTARDDGTVTQITQAGPDALSGSPDGVLQLAYLNHEFCIVCGNGGTTGFSTARLGTIAYVTIVPPLVGDFRPYFLSSFAGHLIASYVKDASNPWRTVMVSDQGDESVWFPDIGNSADAFEIDHGPSGITAQLAITPNQLALFTRDVVFMLTPTGSFPPFTLELAARPGCSDQRPAEAAGEMRHGQQCGVGAAGVLYRGFNNFYMLGHGPLADKLGDYLRANDVAAATTAAQSQAAVPFQWDDLRRVFWVGTAPRAGAQTNELLAYDPTTQAWSRRTLPPLLNFIRQGYIWDNSTVVSNDRRYGRLWIISRTRDLFVEDTVGGTPHDGNFVDSKDFHFGDPPRRIEITRIKVDWEGLGNTTDDLTVSVWARDDFPTRGALGRASGQPPTPSFTTAGIDTPTLGGAVKLSGQSETAARIFGKFIRFRFQAPTGRARIRGFTFDYRYLDKRITP